MKEVQLITLDPGHFHAALVQKEMYSGVAPRVHVYAPLGADLVAHVSRIAGFNARPDSPTTWELEIHAQPDYLERLLREKPGNVVVLSGRNRRKIDYLEAAIASGLHVLADKPWIIHAADLPRLEAVLRSAEEHGLVACDIMTERYEITSILQRELVQDRDVFGEPLPGTESEPGVWMESVHYLLKLVAGVPLRRPAWFFDVEQQGEGLTDVGTHLVDLVAWILLPGIALDHVGDVQLLAARRWPTSLSCDDFQRVTGEAGFPAFLTSAIRNGRLEYYCNTQVRYTLRGTHVGLNVLWDYESRSGSDTHLAVFRGTRSRVEVRQGPEQAFRPELYIVPTGDMASAAAAVRRRLDALRDRYPGLGLEGQDGELRVTIPDPYRVGHEAHFGEVARKFLDYLRSPESVPAWERPNMVAKYHITTAGVGQARTVATGQSPDSAVGGFGPRKA